jgi:hypothetical protein
MIKQYICISDEIAQLFNQKSKEHNMEYGSFHKDQEVDLQLFMRYLHIFGLIYQKHFVYSYSS